MARNSVEQAKYTLFFFDIVVHVILHIIEVKSYGFPFLKQLKVYLACDAESQQ